MKDAKLQTSKWVGLLALVISSGLMTACGKGGSDGGTPTDTTTTSGYICNSAGVCTYNTANLKTGAYAQSPNFVTPGYANNGSSFNVRQGMNQVLKDAMGVCDRYTYSGGYAACSTWYAGAHDMVIYLNGQQPSSATTAKLVIRSSPSAQGVYFTYALPSFENLILNFFGFGGYTASNAGIFDPMVLDATIWPVNNNQGFEIRANGPRLSTAWNKLFQLQVANGKLEDESWNYNFYFNGQLAADGTGKMCHSQYCGMDSSYFTGSGY